MSLYESILRPLLFRFDAETAHHLALGQLAALPPALIRATLGSKIHRPKTVAGITFPNPIGLAAGMDKNGIALPGWEALGFGFVEIGTITAHAQPGNPQPRMFRYPSQRAIVNRMGFNNDGAQVVAERLAKLKASGRWPKIPVGVNLGKSKITELDDAAGDYLKSFQLLKAFGDYFVINVSSPNTVGLRDLQDAERLRQIVQAIRGEDASKPLFVKVAPDLEEDHAREIAVMAEQEGLAGLIATNTTLNHSALPKEQDQTGGLSGAPLRERSLWLQKVLHGSTKLPIIASGGVMDGSAAQEKFAAGASLVQVYTGFVYRGPALIREIGDSLS